MTRIPRLETGVVQDRDDWPGVFIRGDHARQYAMHLEEFLGRGPTDPGWISVDVVRGLIRTLKSCERHSMYFKEPQRILHLAAPEES